MWINSIRHMIRHAATNLIAVHLSSFPFQTQVMTLIQELKLNIRIFLTKA